MRIKRILLLLSAVALANACYEDYLMDFEYSAAYTAFQYDLRTFVYGEEVEVGFTTALAGVVNNTRDRKISVRIDNSLLSGDLSGFGPAGQTAPFTALDGLLGNAPIGALSQDYVSKEVSAAAITALTPLPENYYSTSGTANLSIRKGRHTSDLFIYPKADMFTDSNILKPYYALGFVIDSAEADSLIRDKSFEIIVIKVENRFWGAWYHGGRKVVIRNSNGSAVSEARYPLTIPQSENRICNLATEGFDCVVTDRFSDSEGALRLVFREDGTIRVEDPSGAKAIREIIGQPSHHNQARLIQDRMIYLNYAYSNRDGTTTYVTDTLAFRNRIRDGINEWQDENSQNYQ